MKNFGNWASTFAQRYVPDPFVLALSLTLFVFVLALPRFDYSLVDLSEHWVNGGGKGLWRFLSFSMQMCLILVTGFALAETPAAHRLVTRLAALPKNTRQAGILPAWTIAGLRPVAGKMPALPGLLAQSLAQL